MRLFFCRVPAGIINGACFIGVISKLVPISMKNNYFEDQNEMIFFYTNCYVSGDDKVSRRGHDLPRVKNVLSVIINPFSSN